MGPIHALRPQIQRLDAVRLFGPHAVWKDDAQLCLTTAARSDGAARRGWLLADFSVTALGAGPQPPGRPNPRALHSKAPSRLRANEP
jgi:hypothetical protein